MALEAGAQRRMVCLVALLAPGSRSALHTSPELQHVATACFQYCLVFCRFQQQTVTASVPTKEITTNMKLHYVRWAASLAASVLLTAAVVGPTVADAQATNQSLALTPPTVPADIQVPAGNEITFVGHAVGTQNYVCAPVDGALKFVLFTPRATLFGDDGLQLTTHYFSPNSSEGGTIRATWEDSQTSSAIWGQAIRSSNDPDFVAPGAIPWVLLQQVGTQDGTSSGGDRLTGTTFVQRVNTSGGLAPSNGCNSPNEVGSSAFVPYTADYVFYAAAN